MNKYETDTIKIEAISPINIALVKYWGKIDEHFIIPANNSLSITIDSKDMCSNTKIFLIPSNNQNTNYFDSKIKLILNGKESKVTQRILNVINQVK